MTTYTLTLPYQRPPASLTGNTRVHWRRRSADTNQVRTTVAALGKQARIPAGEHLTVELVWSPGDRRRRDADNLWPLLKVCCDALARGRRDWVGLELVPDDTPKFMTKLAPKIAAPDECSAVGMWLHITVDADTSSKDMESYGQTLTRDRAESAPASRSGALNDDRGVA